MPGFVLVAGVGLRNGFPDRCTLGGPAVVALPSAPFEVNSMFRLEGAKQLVFGATCGVDILFGAATHPILEADALVRRRFRRAGIEGGEIRNQGYSSSWIECSYFF